MDPLAQLKDIHLPDPIHNYPLAFGWWLLAAIIITLTVLLVVKLRKRHRHKKAQRLALKQLKTVNADKEQIISLIKWAALQYFPRQEVAPLYGERLYHFLNEQLPKKQQGKFQTLSETIFANCYQQETIEEIAANTKPTEQIKQAAKLWITLALPPKITKKINPQGDPQCST